MTTPLPVLLDTDIGDDIDDALALALILASPELRLVGVTTVFANATARARQARTVLAAAGERFAKIPVAIGCSRGITTTPYAGQMAQFADPQRLPNQDATCLPETDLPPVDPRHAVDFIVDTIMAGDGTIVPVLIGAMTNLAMAIVREPRIVPKIPQLAIMAGEFRRPMAEWNILCDPEAAAIVFTSGVPVRLIPWHVGDVVQFRPQDTDRLDAATSTLCRRLAAAVKAWQADRRNDHNALPWPIPRLYDPMAVACLMRPELCTWKTGTVRVELQGRHTFGYTAFKQHADGPHQVAWDTDRGESIAFFLNRVLAHDTSTVVADAR